MTKQSTESPEWAIFQTLAYEFPNDDRNQFDRKVRRKLSRSSTPFNPAVLNKIRLLKNDLQSEISKFSASAFFTGAHGPFASPEDFDFEGLLRHYTALYTDVAPPDLGAMINFSIYLYYLR